MRSALWPDSDPDNALADAQHWLARTDAATFVGTLDAKSLRLVGFVEVGERPFADGCASSPVAFLEAWYVDTDQRHLGMGRQLVDAAAAWAGSRNLREFASDADLENLDAQRAHQSLGFAEVERAVRYRRPL